MWFPVGEAPGSSAGRAVQAKWTPLPALQSLWRVFLQPSHPTPHVLVEGWQRHVDSRACGHKVAPLFCPLRHGAFLRVLLWQLLPTVGG